MCWNRLTIRSSTMAREVGISLVLLISGILGLSQAQNESPVVQTTTGPVQGITKTTILNHVQYSAYLGIPYAVPPLGSLRFKPPVPIEPWTNVLNASKDGSPCPQIDFFTTNYMGDEDCLNLNVYTRNVGNTTELKKVMVWIFGGAFSSGYCSSDFYGPDFFIDEDIVVACGNYRLGVLGFGNLNHPDALGNAGLKDQNLVLRWIQDNIAAFGGDPNEITLFGESAGSVSVGLHVLSPKSRGLFKQVIYQSGSPLCQWATHSPEKAHSNALELAHRLGYSGSTNDELVQFLREADTYDLLNKSATIDGGALPFRPSIENAAIANDDSVMLNQCPIVRYQTGNYYKVPTLMGHNADEMLFFLNVILGNGTHQEAISNLLYQGLGLSGIANELLSELSAVTISTLPESWLAILVRFFSDLLFHAPIDLTRELLGTTNGDLPIYYYLLEFRSAYNLHEVVGVTINGTAHVDDVGYLFNVDLMHAPLDPNHPLNQFRKRFVHLWANFAKYGNPTPTMEDSAYAFDITWLDSNPTGIQLNINTTSSMGPNTLDALSTYYKTILPNLLMRETGCSV